MCTKAKIQISVVLPTSPCYFPAQSFLAWVLWGHWTPLITSCTEITTIALPAGNTKTLITLENVSNNGLSLYETSSANNNISVFFFFFWDTTWTTIFLSIKRGKSEAVKDFIFWASKSLWVVTAAMELKTNKRTNNTCSFEEKERQA